MSGNSLEVAIVADDLTGALDMAAPFAAKGFVTQLLLDPERSAARDDTQVLTLTSASRDLPPAAAEANIRVAIHGALACKPRMLISKIDSALRGDVAGAILTGLKASGIRHALIAPAVPSQGRSLRGGEVYVNGVALRENPLGFVPSSLPSAPLPELLRRVSAELSVHSWRRGQVLPLSDAPGLHAYVADCESDADMDTLARLAIDHSARLLAVGASGLGTAIARQLGAGRTEGAVPGHPVPAQPCAPVLFVIGSRTLASADQIARLLAQGAQEIAMPFPAAGRAVNSGDAAARGADASLVLLRPSTLLEFDRSSSGEIASALGMSAADLVRRLAIRTMVMSGGDTALAVFRALGVAEACLLRELSPGMALGTFRLDGEEIMFVTKSGSFGDADALIDISRALQGGGRSSR
jgi:D-threonate/D-erythronate kinase